MDYETLDKPKLVRQLRRTLAPRIGVEDAPLPVGEYAAMLQDEDDEDLTLLRHGTDIYNIPLLVPRRFGFVLLTLRKVWRKILKPILMRQVAYNSANTRVIEGLNGRLSGVYREAEDLKRQLDTQISETTERYEETIDRLQQQIDRLQALQHQQAQTLETLLRDSPP